MNFKEYVQLDNDVANSSVFAVISEGAGTNTRYSVEVNYRTTLDQSLEATAKIILGYVSAAMKQSNFHTKHVYDTKPLRVMVSSRNWDDGEWVGLVSYNPEHNCFIVSKGFYNRDRKTVSIQNSKKCSGDNASEIVKELRNQMHQTSKLPDRQREKLNPVPLKTGPKKT
jgi:hypothetical protein